MFIGVSYAQNLHLLQKQVAISSMVVEATVIQKQSFYIGDNIFTSYKLKVFSQYKGKDPKSIIEIIKVGGEIGDEGLTVYPSIELNKGDRGLFVLQAFHHKNKSGLRLLTSNNSFLSIDYQRQELNNPLLDAPNMTVPRLRQYIERWTGQRIELDSSNQKDISLQYRDVTIGYVDTVKCCAGCGQIIKIFGSGFSDTRGDFGAVLFTNANLPGQSISIPAIKYVSWSENEIEVEVPYDAASGPIVVRTNNFEQSDPSWFEMDVQFNILNSPKGNEIRLIDDEYDGDFGYRFYLSDLTDNNGVDFTSLPEATNILYDAFAEFNNNLPNFAIYLDDACLSASIQVPSNDHINIISFDNDIWDLDMMSGDNTYGAVYLRWIKCGDSDPEVVDIDIFLRRDGNPNDVLGAVKWNFNDTLPKPDEMDFKSVVMHQLGHAVLLGHVKIDSLLMYKDLLAGGSKRYLKELDKNGAIYVHEQSKAYLPPIINCGYQFNYPRNYGDYDSTKACSSILSLQEITLKAQKVNNLYVQLDFETKGEQNIDRFEIQRKRVGGIFETISELPSNIEDNHSDNEYSYVDSHPYSGVNYYRIAVFHEDNTISYSNLARVELDEILSLKILNNPVLESILKLDYSASLEGKNFEIYNSEGQLVKTGIVQNEIPVSGISAGVYFFIMRSENLNTALKFIKYP